jgi:AAA family ATP:ADP antiporter
VTEGPVGAPAPESAQLTVLERFLRSFSDIRPGEGRAAAILFADVLLILCAYYFIKPLREGWLAVSGVEGLSKMELKAYSAFGQSVVLIGVIAAYSSLVGRWPRHVLIQRSTVFCMSNMLIFWLLQPGFFVANLPVMGILFYLWVGIFGVFVVAQFWAFAADLYDDESGKRLLPVIAIGATSGAAVGSWLAQQLVRSGIVPTEHLLLAALVPLGISVLLTRAADEANGTPDHSPAPGHQLAAGPDRRGGLGLVTRSRFLLAVAGVTLLLNWVNTNGENILFRVVQETLETELAAEGGHTPQSSLNFVRDGTTLFYGNFFFWVNVIALILQAFVASRLLKFGGFGAIFLLLPVIAFTSYTAMALVPLLPMIKAMKIAENATDYSINNTARHVLWLPMTSEITLKAKPTIDSLFVRAGDGLAALTVMLGVQLLAGPLEFFLVLNVALVLLWLLLGVWVVREHRRRLDTFGGADALG